MQEISQQTPARFYIAVRGDLTPGLVAAQAVHAACAFAHEHRALFTEWLEHSNFLVIVEARDEAHVISIADQAREIGLPLSQVDEPDLDSQVTAVALGPGAQAKHLCANLPLALKVKAMV